MLKLAAEFLVRARLPRRPGMVGPVYHGTSQEFEDFSLPEDVADEDFEGIGVHFGTVGQAETAARRSPGIIRDEGSPGEGANIRPAYLKIGKPLRMPDMNEWDPEEVAYWLLGHGVVDRGQLSRMLAISRAPGGIDYTAGYRLIREWLDAKGYDAIVYRNKKEGKGDSYVVWHLGQIVPALREE
jgi:hypothetical protein